MRDEDEGRGERRGCERGKVRAEGVQEENGKRGERGECPNSRKGGEEGGLGQHWGLGGEGGKRRGRGSRVPSFVALATPTLPTDKSPKSGI